MTYRAAGLSALGGTGLGVNAGNIRIGGCAMDRDELKALSLTLPMSWVVGSLPKTRPARVTDRKNVMTFNGLPAEAFGFYERLEVDNSKSFWAAHKAEYEQYVREPMIALGDELVQEFGDATVFRPYRDIRFSADKSPY